MVRLSSYFNGKVREEKADLNPPTHPRTFFHKIVSLLWSSIRTCSLVLWHGSFAVTWAQQIEPILNWDSDFLLLRLNSEIFYCSVKNLRCFIAPLKIWEFFIAWSKVRDFYCSVKNLRFFYCLVKSPRFVIARSKIWDFLLLGQKFEHQIGIQEERPGRCWLLFSETASSWSNTNRQVWNLSKLSQFWIKIQIFFIAR